MLRILAVTFLSAIATNSMAAPVDDQNIFSIYKSLFGDSNEQKNNKYICTDFYSFLCNETDNKYLHHPEYKEHLAQLYSSQVHKVLIDILNGELKDQNDPIDLERQLFQSCMNLGNNNDDNDNEKVENNVDSIVDVKSQENINSISFTTEAIFYDMMQHFHYKIDEQNWQKLDRKLASIGFKHSFFEINVVKDPENNNKNIIRLSPPSIREWNFKKLTDVVSDIFTQQQLNAFDYCKEDESSENSKAKNDWALIDNDSAFWESKENENDFQINVAKNSTKSKYVMPICKEILLNERSELTEIIVQQSDFKVMELLNNILKGIFDTMDTANTGRKVQKISIDQWNKMYNKTARKNTAAIDWYQLITSYFEHFKVHIKNTDYILVENQPYFFKMAKFFGRASNEEIAHTVRSKFVAENIRYFNWNWVYAINPVDKSLFCLEQNAFYAASAEVLERLKLKLKPYMKNVESLLYGIMGALHSNISNATESNIKKKYLLSNLKDFTKDPFETVDHSTISEYYKDFEITGDYLVDINRYKNIMRKGNLRKLQDGSLSLPFSVLKTDYPRNRYILHSALNAIIYRSKFLLDKSALYGSFGVKTASILFSLLREKTFENDLRDFQGILSIIPRVSYDPQKVSCFIHENIVKYGYPVDYNIITEVFSVRFAYEALLNNLKAETTEQFFIAYVEDHCQENDRKMIKKVLSNVKEFSTTFECSENENTVCKLQAFY